MQAAAETYAVINADEETPFFRDVADALVNVTDMHRIDAMQRAKDAHYFFIYSVPLPTAQGLWNVLAGRGISSLVVPMDYVTNLGQVYQVNNCNCTPDCFEVEHSVEPLRVPWEQVAMLSYGRVQVVERKSSDGSGFDPDVTNITGIRGFERVAHVTPKYDISDHTQRHVEECLDIFIGSFSNDEFFAHFRMNPQRFYYDYLGDRSTTTSRKNFLLFLDDIFHYAPNAIATGRLRQFLDGKEAKKPFEDYQAFDRYNLWSTAIEHARSAGEI